MVLALGKKETGNCGWATSAAKWEENSHFSGCLLSGEGLALSGEWGRRLSFQQKASCLDLGKHFLGTKN